MEQWKIDRINNAGFIILSYSSDNKSNPLVTFKDGEGYLFKLRYIVLNNTIRRNCAPNRFFNNNCFTYENIKLFLNKNNINLDFILDGVEKATQKIEWFCLKHGAFYRTWNEMQSLLGCPFCNQENKGERRRLSFEEVEKVFTNKNYILLEEIYKGNDKPLRFVCKKHLEAGEQITTYSAVKKESCDSCKICYGEKLSFINTKSQEQFEKELQEKFNNKIVLIQDYKNTKEKALFKCSFCGFEWKTKPTHILSGHGCPSCNESLGEKFIKLYLDKNKIIHKRFFSFEDCVGDKRKLSFDFALFKDEELCGLIEYQGKQHYFPVEQFGGQKSLEKQQLYDFKKREYCKNNNIPLLEIDYRDIKLIPQLLEDFYITISKKGG